MMTQTVAASCGTHPTASEPLLFSKRDAAKMLSISVRTLDTLLSEKELRCVRIRGRVLIHRDDLNQFARGRRVSRVN